MVSATSSSVPPASSSRTSPLHLTSSEINILIHCYLLESNLAHSAFTFALETKLASLPEVGKKVPRGELLRWLHRGLAWQEVEAHVGEDGPLPPCSSPFTLLTPHVCDPIPPSTPSPSSSSHIPLPSAQQSITLPIASTSASSAPPPPPRPELFPEPSPADDTTTVASAASVGSSSAKGKRKAVNGAGEKHGDGDSESGSVGEKSSAGGGKKDESGGGGGSSSKRARVEKEKKEDVEAESRKAQAKASKVAPKPLPLPSFQRKSTSTSTSNPPRPTSSSSSTTSSSKPTSPSTTLHSLPNTSSNLNSTSNNHSSTSTTAGTSSTSKKSNSTTTSPTLSSNRTLAPSSTTTTGTSQKKKKPSSSTSTSTNPTSSSSTPAFVDKAPGVDYTKTIRTVSLSFEASPDGSSSSEEGEGSTSASTAAGKSAPKGKNGKGGKGKGGKGKGKVRIFGGEHNGEVFVCKFSPVKQSGGGEVLATGAGDATVRLWEFQPPGAPGSTDPEGWSMEESPTICKHLPVTDRKDITSIDFNPPGTLIGTASYDGIARLWTPEGELHGVLTRHSGAIFCLKFNPTGSLLATAGSDGSVCVWEADSARLRQAYEFHSDCTLDVDWLDDDTLASCSMDKTITICRVGSSTPYRTFRGHTDEVNRVAWSPAPPSSETKPSSSFGFGSSASASSSLAGRVLASCSDDATVRIWGLDVEPSTLSDDGGFQNGRLEKYCKGVLRGHEKEIYTFAFAPTSVGSSSSIPILATASFDQTVRLWDISSLSCLRVLRAHTETVFSISFSPTGRHLASAGWDKLMVVWETETGKPVRHRAGEAGIFELEWSKNAGVVAVCQSDKSVVLVDVKELE